MENEEAEPSPLDDAHDRYLDALAEEVDPALEAHVDSDGAVLTPHQREFLLSREEPNADNRVLRTRIRARFRRALLDLALMAQLLPPDEFQKTLDGDSSIPEGGHAYLSDGLMAGVQFAAEGYDRPHEFKEDAADAIYRAFHRRGDTSVYNVTVDVDIEREGGGWWE